MHSSRQLTLTKSHVSTIFVWMDANTARTLLGVQSNAAPEEVMERLDAESFAVRDHFIRQPIVPAVYSSRVDRLVQLSDIANALSIEPLGAPVELPELVELNSSVLTDLVEGQIENILRLRTAMAGTLDPDVLARFGQTLVNIQLRYMEAFLALTQDHPADNEVVPAREECDWQLLLKTIRQPGEMISASVIAKERNRMNALLKRSNEVER